MIDMYLLFCVTMIHVQNDKNFYPSLPIIGSTLHIIRYSFMVYTIERYNKSFFSEEKEYLVSVDYKLAYWG